LSNEARLTGGSSKRRMEKKNRKGLIIKKLSHRNLEVYRKNFERTLFSVQSKRCFGVLKKRGSAIRIE